LAGEEVDKHRRGEGETGGVKVLARKTGMVK